MKRLSKGAGMTVFRLRERVSGVVNTTPSMRKISELLTEMEIPHEFKEYIQTKDKRNCRNHNIIRRGNVKYKGYYLKVADIEIITSDAIYRRNPYPYIVNVTEFINKKLEERDAKN